jgi:uncharacterized protein with HEPN domain
MKQREARVFLFEIHRACDLVLQFTSGMSLSEYGSDVKTRSAVERQLEIVGEAMGQMLKSFPEMQQDFPEAPRIIAFRNLATPRCRTRWFGGLSRRICLGWQAGSGHSSLRNFPDKYGGIATPTDHRHHPAGRPDQWRNFPDQYGRIEAWLATSIVFTGPTGRYSLAQG